MAWELVAQGNILDATELDSYDSYLAEGQKGLLALDLRLPVSQSVASELETKLRQAGVKDIRVNTASPVLQIEFRKASPWLAVIAAVILGIIILAILITGWRFFRDIAEVIPAPILSGLSVVILVGAVLLVMAGIRKRG